MADMLNQKNTTSCSPPAASAYKQKQGVPAPATSKRSQKHKAQAPQYQGAENTSPTSIQLGTAPQE